MPRRTTSTSAFGVSKRESHDATGFYNRFTSPELSPDDDVHPAKALDKLVVGDARSMGEVPDASVALVVTSPPYFAGKEYEEALGEGGVPATYLEYLDLLRDVFTECVRTLEPGGRIAVNVANLGRRPYRSLSADVITILQNDLRLLLRGEVIWLKQRGSSGSCAWGSFQRPGNPVLRDVTERIIIASKGRFDRAVPAPQRHRKDLPSEVTMTREDFMENTLDVWEFPPESATRIGHPAPFPVELPSRLIGLFTYKGDLVLDPFLGSGSSAVAAVRTGRHYVGYDLDESYVRLAEARVSTERQRLADEGQGASARRVSLPAVPAGPTVPAVPAGPTVPAGPAGPAGPTVPAVPAVPVVPVADDGPYARALRAGKAAKEIAREAIAGGGFTDIEEDQRRPGGIVVNFSARDSSGALWLFDLCGSFTSHRAGLSRADTLWKALGTAAVLRETSPETPLVLLATDVPLPGSAGAAALKQVCGPGKPIDAVVELLEPSALRALGDLCRGGRSAVKAAGRAPARPGRGQAPGWGQAPDPRPRRKPGAAPRPEQGQLGV